MTYQRFVQEAVHKLAPFKPNRFAKISEREDKWGVGLGGGYLMGITLGWGGIGLWYGLILAPAISSIFLMVWFYRGRGVHRDMDTVDKILLKIELSEEI